MYKNYFFIFRCIKELSTAINGNQIFEIYSQEKDKLFLHIPLKDKPLFHLNISINPQQHYIAAKDEHHKAKKNTISFFDEFLPSKITSIKIALVDRIIEFTLSNSKLYVVFRGGQSNIYLIDSGNNLYPFKKVDKVEKERFLTELPSLSFSDSFSSITSYIDGVTEESTLRKLPFIGKDILREADSRKNDFKKNLSAVVNEIVHEKIAVYYNEQLGKPGFHPVSFISAPIPVECFVFDNYFSALNKYFALSFSEMKVKNVRKEIEKFLTKSIESLTGKLNNLKGRVDAGTKEKIYHQSGDLLLANIHLLRKGMKEIEVDIYPHGEKHKIKLDEKLSPHKNIDRYYDKSRAERIEYQRSTELLELNAKEYERLIKIRDKFDRTEDQEELLQIKKELKMKTQSTETDEKKDKSQYRHFLLENKFHIFVGKDSKNNDMLTTKFAKQNDFWFHARSVSGSHVVLRVENTKEAIPKSILHKTASIAAFYSKAKTSKLVPVTYTLKKYVIKNARHEPGQVTVTKEKVLLVKPEIPAGCEMVMD
ncbi:MAG: NFACT RNA binding domain-containing protein [Melioribacteraceae bacterium]|nr:NFACT RNA binding domain-containing protein [Melioribacteraceae bacterium]